jgi:hypothetical protein
MPTWSLNFKHIDSRLRQIIVLFCLSAIALLSLSIVTAGPVYADIASSDPVLLYCQRNVPQKAKAGCTSSNIERARNVATHHCKDQPKKGNKKADCVEQKAIGYIKRAAKDATSKADFTKQLNAVFDDVGGNPNKPSDDSGQIIPANTANCKATDALCADCQNGGNGCISCENGVCGDPAADPDAVCDKDSCDLILKYVNPLISLLSVSFGLIAVISIIIGGIQYTSSAGDPQKVTKAKHRISLTIIAIVAYFFLYAFLQFLIPGGIFNRA